MWASAAIRTPRAADGGRGEYYATSVNEDAKPWRLAPTAPPHRRITSNPTSPCSSRNRCANRTPAPWQYSIDPPATAPSQR